MKVWRPIFGLAIVTMALSTPRLVRAEQIVDVSLTDKVIPGQQPSLTISAFADVKRLTIDLKRDDGKRIQESKTNVARGSKRTFVLPQTAGRHRYRGTLQVELHGGGGGSMNLDFVALIMASMGLSVASGDLDLNGRTLVLRAKRTVAQVDYEITADNGALVGQGSHRPDQAGRQVTVPWQQNPGQVLKIHLVAHDEEGFQETIDLFPWSWSIPHEEVIFETGKWDIRDSEAPKLDKSYKLIRQGLAKYGKLLPIKLYIAGHTDTVADDGTNLVLSEKRALAIARHFRQQGFGHPIFYQGFGERSLKIQTADNVDEAQNRRAEYVLAANPPPVAVAGAGRHWKKL